MSHQRHLRRYTNRQPPPLRPGEYKAYSDDVMEWVRNNWETQLSIVEQARGPILDNLHAAAAAKARGESVKARSVPVKLPDGTSFSIGDSQFYDSLSAVSDALGLLKEKPANIRQLTHEELAKHMERLLAKLSQELKPENASRRKGEGQSGQQSGQGGSPQPGQGQGEPQQGRGQGQGQSQSSSSSGQPGARRERDASGAMKAVEQREEAEEGQEQGQEEGQGKDAKDTESDLSDWEQEAPPEPRYDGRYEGDGAGDRSDQPGKGSDGEGPSSARGGESTSARTVDSPEYKTPKVKIGGSGGGEQIRDGHPEDAQFWAARRAIMNLCVAPDPLDKPELGEDVYDVRRVAKARYNPAMLSQIRREVGQTVDNVYVFLDTSGSVSEYAKPIANIAAAAAGIVHIFTGTEARPEFKVERNSPLSGPAERFEEWRNQRDLHGATAELANRFRQFISEFESANSYAGSAGGCGDFGSSFETDVAWFLETEQPPKGSHIIIWTDTQECGVASPRLLKALLADYHVTLLVPYTREEVLDYVGGETKLQRLIELGIENDSANTEYSDLVRWMELPKFIAMEWQVLYGVKSGESFAEALRFIS